MYGNEESKKEIKLLEIEEKFKDLDNKILSIDIKLTQVVDAILGNSLTKEGGFIKKLTLLESKIHELEKKTQVQEEFRKKFLWTIALITALGALVQFIVHLYTKTKN